MENSIHAQNAISLFSKLNFANIFHQRPKAELVLMTIPYNEHGTDEVIRPLKGW